METILVTPRPRRCESADEILFLTQCIKNAGNLAWPQETHVPRNVGLGQTFIHVQAFYLLNKTYNLYNAVIRKGD